MRKPWKRPDYPIAYGFLHSGYEHNVCKYNKLYGNMYFKDWNCSNKHKRKYIRSDGKYVDRKGNEQDAVIEFLGEWEPYSLAVPFSSNKPGHPQYYHKPFLINEDAINPSGNIIEAKISRIFSRRKGRKQNTDPYVFGESFIYSSICKPEQTQNIKPGSIILFGSITKTPAYSYRIDTVFVIKEIVDLDMLNNCDKGINPAYSQAVLNCLEPGTNIQRKIFIGATPDNPINGMYSFVPAILSGQETKGIMPIDSKWQYNGKNLFKNLERELQQSGRILCDDTSDFTVNEFWTGLLKYTREQGYIPATKISAPPIFCKFDDFLSWIAK